MNTFKTLFYWIASLFKSLFTRESDDDAEKPTLCGGPAKKDDEGK